MQEDYENIPREIGYLCFAGRTRYRYVIVRSCRRAWRTIVWVRLRPTQYRFSRGKVADPVDFWWSGE